MLAFGVVVVQSDIVKYQQVKFRRDDDQQVAGIKAQELNSVISPIPSDSPQIYTQPDNQQKVDTITPAVKSQSDRNNDLDISTYVYPNSKIISQNLQEAVLESIDSPGSITNWYEGKIKADGFRNNAFIRTNINGYVLDTISSVKTNKKITVEINKSPNSSITKINIKLSSS